MPVAASLSAGVTVAGRGPVSSDPRHVVLAEASPGRPAVPVRSLTVARVGGKACKVERLWAPWRLEYVTGAARGEAPACVFLCGARSGEPVASRRVPRTAGLRHSQQVPVQQRSSDGRPDAARGAAGGGVGGRADRADHPHAGRRDGADRELRGARHQRRHEPRAGPPGRAWSGICTCTSFRGGTATRTS